MKMENISALASEPMTVSPEVFQQLGTITRLLHDTMQQLGVMPKLQIATDGLPDARSRLSYIASKTAQAAEKVLNSVDQAKNVQQEMARRAIDLRQRWQAVATFTQNDPTRSTPAGRQLVEETHVFFDTVGGQSDRMQSILTEIMMAQDFHDLTGQVIRKVVDLAQTVEEQLVKLLIETTPPERRKAEHPQLEGPVVNTDGRTDIVTDQQGVDELLASLGF